MYATLFGLKQDPFAMTPDPGFLLMTSRQREALAGLVYAILARKGFAALIGEAGTGKTTLLNKLMTTLAEKRALFSVVLNPTLTPQEFLECALTDFGIRDLPQSKTQRLLALDRLLLEADKKGSSCVLIVDEAHKLSSEVLEEIRLLSNFERPEGKLLQIILAGQPALGDVLDRYELQQLKQRVAVRLRIGRLTAAELQGYVAHRWKSAGGSQHPFSESALERLALYSEGIPRVVNAVCDNALMLAVAEGMVHVTEQHIQEAAHDLALIPAPANGNGKRDSKLPDSHVPVTIPMLERYGRQQGGSALMRWLGRFRLAN
jgi:general secretion pathway protein A